MTGIPRIRDYQGKRIHLIGIGGSSMSGLAEMLQEKGYRVTGSDRDHGYLLDSLEEKKIPVTVGHKAENVHGADLVVYSAAIHPDNPERAEAERLGIPSKGNCSYFLFISLASPHFALPCSSLFL